MKDRLDGKRWRPCCLAGLRSPCRGLWHITPICHNESDGGSHMQLLMIHVGLGGAVAAGGAFVAGIILVGLRVIFSPRFRGECVAAVRKFGVAGAIRQALFDDLRPETELRKGAAT